MAGRRGLTATTRWLPTAAPRQIADLTGIVLAIVCPPRPVGQKTDGSNFGQLKSCSLAETTPSIDDMELWLSRLNSSKNCDTRSSVEELERELSQLTQDVRQTVEEATKAWGCGPRTEGGN